MSRSEALEIRRASTSIDLTPEQIDVLRRTIARKADDDELALFLATARRLGLDPFAQQIYAVFRFDRDAGRDVMSIQIGIDGYRLVAERTGLYRGQRGPEWAGPDGAWRDVWLESSPPAAARVGVLRAGFERPLWSVATYRSFVQTTREGKPRGLWRTMPDVMLAKAAERNALARAFPIDLSELGEAARERHVYEPRMIEIPPEPELEAGAEEEVVDPIEEADEQELPEPEPEPQPLEAVADPPAEQPELEPEERKVAAEVEAELAADEPSLSAPATQAQWERARAVIGPVGAVVRAYQRIHELEGRPLEGAVKPAEITAEELGKLILAKINGKLGTTV